MKLSFLQLKSLKHQFTQHNERPSVICLSVKIAKPTHNFINDVFNKGYNNDNNNACIIFCNSITCNLYVDKSYYIWYNKLHGMQSRTINVM